MQNTIQINVGGTLFRIEKSTLQKYPDTRLGSISEQSACYSSENDSFYFDRNPEMFNCILDFYRNDEIHLPTTYCAWLWKSELKYWNISLSNISKCCSPIFSKYEEDEDIAGKLRSEFTRQNSSTSVITSKSQLTSIKNKIWLFLDEPSSSIFARIFSAFYIVMILISATIPCLSTYPSIREERVNVTTLIQYAKWKQFQLWVDLNNSKELMFVTTLKPSWLLSLEIVTMSYFTVETTARFLTCPSKCKFMKEWLNIIDIILFVAMWTKYALEKLPMDEILQHYYIPHLLHFTDCLLVFRLLRFYRLAKQYSGLKIFFLALKASVKELFLLLVTFFVTAWVFANLIYFAEVREVGTFPNMLVGLWWSVVTMTTVGYGDMYPVGTAGRVVAAVCTMLGLLVLAMPIAVISGNFSDLYRKNKERETYNKLQTIPGQEPSITKTKIVPFAVECIPETDKT